MTFAEPAYLLLAALLLPVIGVFLVWANRLRRGLLDRMGDLSLLQRLTSSVNWRNRRRRIGLSLAALALVLIALARPQWGQEVREVEQEGLQVMVALDVSKSMLAQDIAPSRLERARLEIAELMERLNGDEIGLVLFSGASFIQVPLTSDYVSALNYLDSAGPQAISRPGTVIGDAIHTALGGFDPNLNSQKVLIILTDGEDHESDPVAAAQEAADQGVLIYTIGFGTVGGEAVPEVNERGEVIGLKKDQEGQVVISRLDETTLREIARTGKGRYFQAAPDGGELDELLAEISDLQRAQLPSRLETRRIERFQLFLGLGLAALVAAELLPDRKGENGSRRALLPTS